MKLTFCDAHKCQELTSLSHSSLLPVNKKYRNEPFLSQLLYVPILFFFSFPQERNAIAAGSKKRIYIWDIIAAEDEIRTMPYSQLPTPVRLDTATQCNGDKIGSAPSRFHDCKGQARDRQNDYDRRTTYNKFTNCADTTDCPRIANVVEFKNLQFKSRSGPISPITDVRTFSIAT